MRLDTATVRLRDELLGNTEIQNYSSSQLGGSCTVVYGEDFNKPTEVSPKIAIVGWSLNESTPKFDTLYIALGITIRDDSQDTTTPNLVSYEGFRKLLEFSQIVRDEILKLKIGLKVTCKMKSTKGVVYPLWGMSLEVEFQLPNSFKG